MIKLGCQSPRGREPSSSYFRSSHGPRVKGEIISAYSQPPAVTCSTNMNVVNIKLPAFKWRYVWGLGGHTNRCVYLFIIFLHEWLSVTSRWVTLSRFDTLGTSTGHLPSLRSKIKKKKTRLVGLFPSVDV